MAGWALFTRDFHPGRSAKRSLAHQRCGSPAAADLARLAGLQNFDLRAAYPRAGVVKHPVDTRLWAGADKADYTENAWAQNPALLAGRTPPVKRTLYWALNIIYI
jgi:hypothetical protein